MKMTEARWSVTNSYLDDVFGREDQFLSELRRDAVAAGLPEIEVSPAVGRFLQLSVGMIGAQSILEIGTLGGYSTTWLARGLPPGGHIITVEQETHHAEFAQSQFLKAGLADRVQLRVGNGHAVAASLHEELGDGCIDLAFVDADKSGYPAYWRRLRNMVAVGGLLIVDNALGTGTTWIDDLSSESIRATDEMNRMAASDDDYEVACLPIREGMLFARRVR